MKTILDFETDSDLDVTVVGAHAYARHPSTTILCCSITDFDTGEQRLWLPGDPPPPELSDITGQLEAHGATFERQIIAHIAIPRHSWPQEALTLGRWRDTMAACAYRSLPLGLEDAAKVLHLPEQKGKMPAAPWDTFDKQQAGYAYCLLDGRVQWHLSQRVGEIPPEEQKVWELDQIINDRGFCIDQELCRKAISIVAQVKEKMHAEIVGITGGVVTTSKQRARILKWLGEMGVYLPGLKKLDVAEALRQKDLPQPARRLLEIRKVLAKSSEGKFKTALLCVCPDGRARGQMQYHGASTGRWAGRLIQPHNFARPGLNISIEELVAAIKTGDADFVQTLYGDVFAVLKDAVRGIIVAAPGHKLVVGDFSSIEGVVNACISEEAWKIEAYRAGEDMYCLFASQALGFMVDKTIAKDHKHPDFARHSAARQDVGKPGELAFGYEGGVGAWRKFDLSDKFDDEEVQGFKFAWRDQHPMFKALWRGLNDGAIKAVARSGEAFSYHGCTFRMEQGWLSLRLPSGRKLWYNEPRAQMRLMPWTDRDGGDVFRPAVQVRAWKDGQWTHLDLFGGHLTENAVSGSCRDILVGSMFRLEALGIPLILHIHDENVVEVPVASPFGPKDMERIMGAGETWTPNWPIAAKAWSGPRFKKD